MKDSVRVTGQIVVPNPSSPGEKDVRFLEALSDAVNKAPPPGHGDVQNYRVVDVRVEYGGIAMATTTEVTIEVEDGPIPRSP